MKVAITRGMALVMALGAGALAQPKPPAAARLMGATVLEPSMEMSPRRAAAPLSSLLDSLPPLQPMAPTMSSKATIVIACFPFISTLHCARESNNVAAATLLCRESKAASQWAMTAEVAAGSRFFLPFTLD